MYEEEEKRGGGSGPRGYRGCLLAGSQAAFTVVLSAHMPGERALLSVHLQWKPSSASQGRPWGVSSASSAQL